MRNLVLIVCGALLLSAQAAPSPVIAHYRAYNAALERGDMATAESEASQAYDASLAQDAAGGRTGVLAANLAKIRLHNGHVADAYVPARQAFDIANGNPAADVDPLLATLLLGRAELTEQHAGDGQPRLRAALEAAKSRPDLGADAYDAAVQLAQWNAIHEDFGLTPSRQGDLAIAADAWNYAAQFAQYAPGDHQIAQAEALLAEGVARFNLFRHDPDAGPSARSRAIDALTQAAQILAPLAAQRAGTELTLAQRDYGYAMAWGINSGAAAEHPDAFRFSFGADPNTAAAKYCPTHIVAEPQPHYPMHAASIEREGVVILRILIDDGHATDIRVASAIPGFWFADAVAEVAPQWRIEPVDDAPDDCVMPSVRFQFVRFLLRD